MSVELVTGYSGVGSDGQPNRHVSSADDGARQAGTVGTGMYVLGTGSKMSATMEDANTLVVADGDAMINGRHVRIPDTLSFTIPTGVQGQKVSNLAVLRYSKAADSVESVTPVVLTGEPDPDSPADPALSEGSVLDGDSPVDMPLPLPGRHGRHQRWRARAPLRRDALHGRAPGFRIPFLPSLGEGEGQVYHSFG